MLKQYLQELKKIALLEKDEELLLWQACAQGCVVSRTKLATAYQPLVFKTAVSFALPENLTLELVQEGNLALITCIERYDYTKGVAFSLFALHRIRGQMVDYLKNNSRELECLTEANSALLVEPSKSAQVLLEEEYISKKLQEALARLPEKEHEVLAGIYFQEQEVTTLAEQINVTPAYIYKLRKQGINRIRGMLAKVWKNFK